MSDLFGNQIVVFFHEVAQMLTLLAASMILNGLFQCQFGLSQLILLCHVSV